MKANLKVTSEVVETLLKGNVVPFIQGSPGIGKSAIAKQIAKKFNLKVIDVRLAQCDPVYLLGFPSLDKDKAYFKPLDLFPLEGDSIPEGYNGWLLLLDEINSAPQSIQAAAYRIILDREVGTNKLHSKVAIIAAGNLETDNAIVMPMSSALISRMAHIETYCDVDTWLNWAESNKIHPYITAFIRFKPTALYTFDTNSAEQVYACPRTWEMLHNTLASTEFKHSHFEEVVASLVSEGVMYEFKNYLKLMGTLPDIKDIVKNPVSTHLPDDLATQWALVGYLSYHTTTDNFAQVYKYLTRMQVELQFILLKQLIKNKVTTNQSPESIEWAKTNSKVLL